MDQVLKNILHPTLCGKQGLIEYEKDKYSPQFSSSVYQINEKDQYSYDNNLYKHLKSQ